MSKQMRGLNHFWRAAGALAMAAQPIWAQYAPAPTSYSVTQVNGMFGAPVAMTIYRDGSKIAMDHPQNNSRSLYDLTAHTQYSWTIDHPENGCSNGNFSGDWGDPFQSADVDAILKSSTTPPGNETVNGFVTKVYEGTDPASKIKIKVWREPKYGMVVKGEMTPPGGATTTVLETKQFSATKPNPSLFVLPPACANAPPPPPTASQLFATDTGDDGAHFADATMGPGSPTSCSMLMRFVAAGTMQPISDFQVALDLAYDQDHPPHYVMGGSPSGRTVFSGGHLKEYTADIHNGVLRVDNIPASFDLELTFGGGNKGASSALLYRKCSGPQTVLLFVVKNPDKVSDGADYVWVKSGKFATVPAH
jgi:hypothetical protein